MTDLEEALRNPLLVTDERFDLTRKAADEIARLRAALREISELGDVRADEAGCLARAALVGKVQP